MAMKVKSARTGSWAGTAAHIWEEDLVIPTYQVGPPGRNPDLFARGYVRIYPYTLCDDLLHRRSNITYKAVNLENEYLRVIVLPELGGHVYSAYDKVAGEEIFYRNQVIKPARIRLRGAWAAYGIEFNFPRGHSVTSLAPVDYRLLEKPDGSVSVAVGDCEQTSRMRWTVIITLRPHIRRLEVTTRLTNRTELPHRYYFWANAAVPANDQFQFLAPGRAFRRFGQVFPFPYQEGVDRRWYKNHPNGAECFVIDCPHDFFGYYDHGRDFGVVHVADRHVMPGKKMFSWGCSDAGLTWSTILSNHDGPYIEIQAGSHETQGDLSLFTPHSTLVWQEYWCPVWKLGPFDFATEKVALRLEVNAAQARAGTTSLRLQVTEVLPECSLVIKADGGELLSRNLNLAPGDPVELVFTLPSPWNTLQVGLLDRHGKELACFTKDAEPLPERKAGKIPKAGGTSAEAHYRKAIFQLEHGNEDQTLEELGKALRRDPHFSPALRDRGMMWLSRGLWHEALKDLKAALLRNPDDGLAHYYLAISLRETGECAKALQEALHVAARPTYGWLGWQLAGELHMVRGRFQEAEDAFRQVLARQPRYPRALALVSACLRQQQHGNEARDATPRLLETDPLEHLALAEAWLLGTDNGLFDKVMRGQPQSFIEVACDYVRVGLPAEAQRVLETYLLPLGKGKHPHPMVHYYLGYIAEKKGQQADARKHYRRAAALPFDYVFPHRLESERVLRKALLQYPNHAHTHYYLGNLLASRFRHEEALALWQQAVKLDPEIAPAWRNIGLTHWHLHHNSRRALAAYTRALELAPDDVDLYWEADRILETLGHTRARVKLLKSAPPKVLAKDKLAKRLASAYYALGQHNKVLEVLRSGDFWPWEGERVLGPLYTGALMAKALRALKRKQYRAARTHLEQSMDYPPNLHTGSRAYARFAKQKVLLAHCLEMLGRQKAAHEVLETAANEQHLGWDKVFSEALYYKGLALLKLRRRPARTAFRRLATGPPRGLAQWFQNGSTEFLRALGHRGLAELEDCQGHLNEAHKLLTSALNQRADFPEARDMLEEVDKLLRTMLS